VISDGSAVLGLGNIGPEGAFPVMEGKSLLFKHFAGIDSVPIVLNTQDPKTIISTIKNIAKSFAGINLEDFSAPNCFEIEETLKKELAIPVIHDDQWGTSVIALAGLINSLKLVKKEKQNLRVVISGTGAAGSAITKILVKFGVKEILLVDSKGILSKEREGLHPYKQKLISITNPNNESGNLADAMKSADVFIGVSAPGIVTTEMVKSMNSKSVIFALANPIPEIMPDIAKKAGAYIVATGRSDFPNQLNNALGFPGIFRGVLTNSIKQITIEHLIAAGNALASVVDEPTPEKIIPSIFNKEIVPTIAKIFKVS